ncbi:phage tail sheath subtilisin-like domain-containing protein [soil metagenome]
MPEYLAPGVYLEEVDLRSRTIAGVSTSTTGFAGETERGPTRPTLVTSWREYARRYGGFIDRLPFHRPHHYLPYAVRGFFENGGRRLVVAMVTGTSATDAALTLPGRSGSTRLRATGPGAWGNNVRVAVTSATGGADRFRLRIVYVEDGGPETSEEFDNLSADPTQPDYAATVVNPASDLVEITDCSGVPSPIDFGDGRLAGGSDAPTLLDDYVGELSPDHPTGLAALAAITGISLMAAPDDVVVDGLASHLLVTCERLRDRFAVTTESHPRRDPALIRPIRDTSWGAVYYPWVRVVANHTVEGTKLVPPTGHVCGIYARVDTSRGVHKAPANEPVNGIGGAVSDLGAGPLSHAVTHAEQERLNPRGVNVIRDFRPQRGVLVWGARTMSSEAEWKYVSVRRLFIFLEQSIDRGLRWVVFEPNTEPTWLAVRQSVEGFLTGVWRDGALQGTRSDHAFFVKCDRTTMTQNDIDDGRLVCEIGVAPVRPAEFVILRFRVSASRDR